MITKDVEIRRLALQCGRAPAYTSKAIDEESCGVETAAQFKKLTRIAQIVQNVESTFVDKLGNDETTKLPNR